MRSKHIGRKCTGAHSFLPALPSASAPNLELVAAPPAQIALAAAAAEGVPPVPVLVLVAAGACAGSAGSAVPLALFGAAAAPDDHCLR